MPAPVKDCAHFYEWNARAQLTTFDDDDSGPTSSWTLRQVENIAAMRLQRFIGCTMNREFLWWLGVRVYMFGHCYGAFGLVPL